MVPGLQSICRFVWWAVMPVSDLGVVMCTIRCHTALSLEVERKYLAQIGFWIACWLFGAYLDDALG